MYEKIRVGSGGTRISLNNYQLFCAISASLMLDVRLRDVIGSIREEASFACQTNTNNDAYLAEMTSGQLFCVLSLVNTSIKLKLPGGDLAALASMLALEVRNFRTVTEKLLKTEKADNTFMGQLYDQSTCVMYMVAHAWMDRRTLEQCSERCPYEPGTQRDEGLPDLARRVIDDLGLPELSDIELHEKLANATNLLIMSGDVEWSSTYSLESFWDTRLPDVFEYRSASGI